jgi:hypothetical protein
MTFSTTRNAEAPVYLVHLHLRPLRRDARLPASTAAVIEKCAAAADGVLHVSIHPEPPARPVVGIYLRAPSLQVAEATAAQLWRQAGALSRTLDAWTLARAEAPLLPEPAHLADRGPGAGWTE